MYAKGSRGFAAASWLMLLVAVAHTLGLLNEAPTDEWAAAIDGMKEATMAVGPFDMNFWGLYVALWIQVGALLVMLAGCNLLLVFTVPTEQVRKPVRALSILESGICAALCALFLYYQVPPPAISFALLTVAFLASALSAHRALSEETD